MDNFKISYGVVGFFIACLSLFSLMMIKEHRRTKKEKTEEVLRPTVKEDCCQNRPGILPRFVCLTRVLKKEC